MGKLRPRWDYQHYLQALHDGDELQNSFRKQSSQNYKIDVENKP